ncbi:MAG: multicopper oxidase family protein [Pseudomonadota bacterium]
MINRRKFIAASVATAIVRPTLASPSVVPLKASVAPVQLAPEGYDTAELWCFDGRSPGPEIRVAQGGSVVRQFQNNLPEPSSVHWHGLRLENAMDGVPGLTQDVVMRGETFDYNFTAPDAGTYWYHSHNRSWEQMARGLYGPLIVEEPDPLDIDQDVTLVFDDWRLDETGALSGNYGTLHDNAHGGRIGNLVTVNGKMEERLQARSGERLRLRLINSANARIFDLGWQGMTGWIVALDGMPLETPQPAERVILAPAQRADLVVDIVQSEDPAVIYMAEDGQGYVLADVAVSAGTRTVRKTSPKLPPNPVPDLTRAPEGEVVAVLMEGGAMGGMRMATHNGQEVSMQDLVQLGMAWALNGVAGLTDKPLFSSDRNALHRVQFINRTAWPHGMHLHGHHFREVMNDGSLGPWRDTLLVGRNETRDIALVANNPGKWLLHCHMLGHQAAGMKTWFEVSV